MCWVFSFLPTCAILESWLPGLYFGFSGWVLFSMSHHNSWQHCREVIHSWQILRSSPICVRSPSTVSLHFHLHHLISWQSWLQAVQQRQYKTNIPWIWERTMLQLILHIFDVPSCNQLKDPLPDMENRWHVCIFLCTLLDIVYIAQCRESSAFQGFMNSWSLKPLVSMTMPIFCRWPHLLLSLL